MGNEACCSKNQEQIEINIKKQPQKNILLKDNPINNNFCISPQINFETERKSSIKEKSEDASSELNIITQEEFVYGRIDSLTLQKIQETNLKNALENDKKNENININTKIINEDKDGPQDNVKNIQQNNNNDFFNENNITTNIDDINSINNRDKNILENNNINNINSNNQEGFLGKAYISDIPDEINYKNKNNNDINLYSNIKNNITNNEILENYNYQEPSINNIKEENYLYNNNDDNIINNNNILNSKEIYLDNFDNNNYKNNNKRIFVRPIVNPLNNTYNNKKNNVQQISQIIDGENYNNNNLIIDTNNNTKKKFINKKYEINLKNEIKPSDNITYNKKIIENPSLGPKDNIIPKNYIFQNKERNKDNIIIPNYKTVITNNINENENIDTTNNNNYDIIENNINNNDTNNIEIIDTTVNNNYDKIENNLNDNESNKIDIIIKEKLKMEFPSNKNENNNNNLLIKNEEENKDERDKIIENNYENNYENNFENNYENNILSETNNNYQDLLNLEIPTKEDESTPVKNNDINNQEINTDKNIIYDAVPSIKENINEIHFINKESSTPTPEKEEINSKQLIKTKLPYIKYKQILVPERVEEIKSNPDILENDQNQNEYEYKSDELNYDLNNKDINKDIKDTIANNDIKKINYKNNYNNEKNKYYTKNIVKYIDSKNNNNINEIKKNNYNNDIKNYNYNIEINNSNNIDKIDNIKNIYNKDYIKYYTNNADKAINIKNNDIKIDYYNKDNNKYYSQYNLKDNFINNDNIKNKYNKDVTKFYPKVLDKVTNFKNDDIKNNNYYNNKENYFVETDIKNTPKNKTYSYDDINKYYFNNIDKKAENKNNNIANNTDGNYIKFDYNYNNITNNDKNNKKDLDVDYSKYYINTNEIKDDINKEDIINKNYNKVNNKDINKTEIINYQYLVNIKNKQNNISKPSYNYSSFEKPKIYSNKVDSTNINYDNNNNEYNSPKKTYEPTLDYNSPIKTEEQVVNYNSPIISSENYTNYTIPTKINNSSIDDYINDVKEAKYTIELSPKKDNNKPIIQSNNKIEKNITPLIYNSKKVLPQKITKTIGQYKQSRKLPQVSRTNITKNNNLELFNNPNIYSPGKNPNIIANNINIITGKKEPKDNFTTNLNYVNNSLINNNQINNNKVINNSQINSNKMINSPYIYQNNNDHMKNNLASSIINQNYLATIQNMNMNSKSNYQIDSLRSSGSRLSNISNFSNLSSSIVKQPKFDNLGNPIYAASLDSPSKNKRIFKNRQNSLSNSLINNDYQNNNNLNCSRLYYPRSLSQEDLDSKKVRINRFNEYNNSRTSSPNQSPFSAPKSSINNNINNISFSPYRSVNIQKINPYDIELDPNTKPIINYYLNMNLAKFVTFSPDSYKLFYPQNEMYFRIPKTGMHSEKEITTYINNNPNLKETYIGSVNQYGYRHGYGRLISPSAKRIGTWQNGKFTGWGREIRNNGEVYEGKFENGKIYGKGIYKYKDILYIGDFENNLRQGKGEKITNRYYYNGYFNNDKIDGYGRIQFINSPEGEIEYEGFFKENNIEGKGIMKWKNGNIYEGEMKNNKMDGQGILKLSNGLVLRGLFKDGKIC